MVIFIVKIDEFHLVEIQVRMEHVVEKGKNEEITTRWSEHKVKESNIDEVVASTKSTALKMACEAARNIHPNWFKKMWQEFPLIHVGDELPLYCMLLIIYCKYDII